MRKVKPLNDFIFKKIFGEKGNEDILISFINAVLKRTNKEPILEIEIIDNKQLTKEVINDKTGIIDVRARTAKGENVDIEVQLTFLEKDIPEATLKELMDLEPAIEKAEKRIEYLSSDEETMNTYWERERSLHERANMINSAEQRGKEEGINLTKKVFKLAATGESISNIANICGISEDEVKEILE